MHPMIGLPVQYNFDLLVVLSERDISLSNKVVDRQTDISILKKDL